MSEMKIGKVIYFNPAKAGGFGFIEHRTPAASGGWFVQKYYFNVYRIQYKQSEQIAVGQFVRFEIDPRPRKFENDLPAALNLQLFNTESDVQLFVLATEGK